VQLRALYPPALATHQEVVASKELFLDTLNKFHAALGAKLLAIPKIGGKALDLHFLYVEVTSRGTQGQKMEGAYSCLQFSSYNQQCCICVAQVLHWNPSPL
jgi:hypothetical protein